MFGVQEVVEALTDRAFTVKRGDPFPQYEQQGEREWPSSLQGHA